MRWNPWRAFAVFALVFVACETGLESPIAGDEIKTADGWIRVDDSACRADRELLASKASQAAADLREHWPALAHRFVWRGDVVVMSRDPRKQDGTPANGLYHHYGPWIELRCGREFVMKHEGYHRLADLAGLQCWRTINHRSGHGLGCKSWDANADAAYGSAP